MAGFKVEGLDLKGSDRVKVQDLWFRLSLGLAFGVWLGFR